MSSLRRLLALSALLVASAGCYDYRPITTPQPAANLPVRVTLTDRGMIDLASLIGPQIEKVDGIVAQSSDLELKLNVTSVINRVGFSTGWSGEAVSIPRGAIARVEQRTLNRKKSWLVGGGTVVATLVTGFAFGLIGNSTPGRGSGGGGGPR